MLRIGLVWWRGRRSAIAKVIVTKWSGLKARYARRRHLRSRCALSGAATPQPYAHIQRYRLEQNCKPKIKDLQSFSLDFRAWLHLEIIRQPVNKVVFLFYSSIWFRLWIGSLLEPGGWTPIQYGTPARPCCKSPTLRKLIKKAIKNGHFSWQSYIFWYKWHKAFKFTETSHSIISGQPYLGSYTQHTKRTGPWSRLYQG